MAEGMRAAVVGAGTMGNGIAHVFAQHGYPVTLIDVSREQLAKAQQTIAANLDRQVRKGKLDEAAKEATLGRLTIDNSIDAAAGCGIIVEAVPENADLKRSILTGLDDVAPNAILASNTSSIPIVRLATATGRPDRVLGMHFFNPAPVQPLVELIPALTTDAGVVDEVDQFATNVLGKKTIRCRDQAGFVVNALLVPYLLAAIRMYESGAASATDIDEGMKNGCAHPMGPLALCDLVGLDTLQSVAEVMFDEYKEPLYAPPPLLRRMVDAGRLGRKSGRGFYEYGG